MKWSLRKKPVQATDEQEMSFLPRNSESVVLVGTPLHVSENLDETTSNTFVNGEHIFSEKSPADLEKFAKLQRLDHAVVTMQSIGGKADDIDDWVDAGVLVKFPAVFTLKEFYEFFTGLTLVWHTDGVAAAVEGSKVFLTASKTDGAVPVSSLLYTILRQSNGSVDLPTLLCENVDDDPVMLAEVTTETILILPWLVNAGVCTVVRTE